jgi:hypothetical protein
MKPYRIKVLAGKLACAAAAAAPLLLLPARAATPTSVVTLESIPGTSVMRVTLVAKAAQRLGIETGLVSEQAVLRKQMVGGLIIPPMDRQAAPQPAAGEFGGFGRPPVPARQGEAVAAPLRPPAAGPLWVLVTLSPGEWDRLAKDKPARLLQLATRDKLDHAVLAQPSGMTPQEDAKRSMLSVYYVLPADEHGLAVNHRVRVELPMTGSDAMQKVVPYSAVYYDAKGAAWVYVSTRPLTFERRRISVERVIGELAILSEGPPAGMAVVTVGAALLYGAEIFKK